MSELLLFWTARPPKRNETETIEWSTEFQPQMHSFFFLKCIYFTFGWVLLIPSACIFSCDKVDKRWSGSPHRVLSSVLSS